MNWREYQDFVRSTTVIDANTYWYASLGLAGETGEVVEHIKKSARTNFADIENRRSALGLELGDVLWYLTRLANELGLELEDIANNNVKKLSSRIVVKDRGVAYASSQG
jgi:NTP pyrophosphatase (non-canonical NTP hydrolase)